MLNELKSFWESMPVEWLLCAEPFVKYRTLIDLLDKGKKDKEVLSTKRLVQKHKLIKKILAKQNRDGYWGTPKDIYA